MILKLMLSFLIIFDIKMSIDAPPAPDPTQTAFDQ